MSSASSVRSHLFMGPSSANALPVQHNANVSDRKHRTQLLALLGVCATYGPVTGINTGSVIFLSTVPTRDRSQTRPEHGVTSAGEGKSVQ